MARILILDQPSGSEKLLRLLSKHELFSADTIHQAVTLADNAAFDLVIVGVLFDQSQMFEVFQAFQEISSLANVPIMGFSSERTTVNANSRNSLEMTAHLVGACDYVDAESMSDCEILDRIELCLSEKRGIGRSGGRGANPTEKREVQERKRQIGN